jgi:hypothetical protein
MRMHLALVLAVTSLASAQAVKSASNPVSPASASAAEHSAVELPVHRVVLYKNGVGYFEHAGRVRGSQDLSIRFTTAQLNDVLKSLTVVDLAGQVTSVRYNSIAPLSERLSTLRVQLPENATREQFLNAMRGARVDVRSGTASATGRLLSVENVRHTDQRTNLSYQVSELSVMSDGGDLRTFELTPATTVRFTEPELNREVSRYMQLIATSRAKDVRQMTIGTSGTTDREVAVSYISEVPVWKSTYRVVLPDKLGEKALLQGWAIVDNTVGEDWKDVQLTLVAGAPQSFIQQISQPLYMRRPTVALPSTAQLTPQTHEGTMVDEMKVGRVGGVPGGLAGGVIGGIVNSSPMAAPAPPPASTREVYKFRKSAPGAASETVEVTAANASVDTESAMLSGDSIAEGSELGDLFQYALKQRITVLQNQSALVPIVQSKIDAEKVTIWNGEEKFPLRALWLKNTSGSTLDGGTFNIVEANAFAGEGVFKELKPDERRLISYAADTAVRVKNENEASDEPYTHIKVVRGLLTLTREQRDSNTYTIHNSDTIEKNVVIEHPAREGWKFLGDAKPEESTADYHRFRVKVAPGATQELKLAEFHPEETTYALTDITSDQFLLISRGRQINQKLQDAMQKILGKKNEIANVDVQLNLKRQEIDRINRDQQRVRENMKALKGSAEEKTLTQRYVSQLNQQEDRLATLNKEVESLNDQRNRLVNELQTMAQEINLDEAM